MLEGITMLLHNLQETEEDAIGKYALRKLRNVSDHRVVTFCSHWHEECEILYVLSGQLDVVCESEHIKCMPGDLIFIQSKALHSGISGENGCDYYGLLFKWSDIITSAPYEKQFVDDIIDGKCSVQTLIHDEKATELFLKLFSSPKGDGVVHMFTERAATYNLLAYLFGQHMVEKQGKFGENKKFNMVIQYINDHFLEPITTDDVAQKFSYSKAYFCRLFKQHMSISPIEYINLLRIERAQKLIKEGKMTFSQIASECGFNSLSYFSSTFKKYIRKSPAVWKEEFLMNNIQKWEAIDKKS